MKTMDPAEMAKQVGAGLLSFPVTHFDENFEFQTRPYQEHVAWLLSHKPAGLFAAGGTGEFFSLTLSEFSNVVRAAVVQTAKQVPLVAGARTAQDSADLQAGGQQDGGRRALGRSLEEVLADQVAVGVHRAQLAHDVRFHVTL